MSTDFVGQFGWLDRIPLPSSPGSASSTRDVSATKGFGSFDFAPQHRSVTVPADEPLCPSTLMNLKVNELQVFPEDDPELAEKRMCRSWEWLTRNTMEFLLVC